MNSLPSAPDTIAEARAQHVEISIEPGLTNEQWRRWDDERRRAVWRAIPEAQAAARRKRVSGPYDLLGDPIDPTSAGRLKAARAAFLATGYTTTHPSEIDYPPDPVMQAAEDQWWAEEHAPMLPLWRRSRGAR